MQRTRNFVTPAARAKISTAIYRTQARTWKGSRGGVAMRFALSDQPNLEGHRIVWSARIRGQWVKGVSGTIQDAVDEIQRKAV